VTDRKEHEQFVVDIPPVKPVVVRYVTESGYCAHCRKRVCSRHAEQISEATGAARVVVGPRAKGLAADMKHRLGVSYGKVCALLDDAFGLRVTRGGWCQADTRLAEQARPVYEELVEALRMSSVVHADETGWRIGTLAAWLWVFTNRETTVYTIRSSRGHEVVVDILGGVRGHPEHAGCTHPRLLSGLRCQGAGGLAEAEVRGVLAQESERDRGQQGARCGAVCAPRDRRAP
jgi:hypothetical protein